MQVTCAAMDYTNNQLLTGSHDGTVRVWDCATGQCVFTSEVGGEVDSMLVEHGWLFVGVKTPEGRGEVRGWALAGGAGGEGRLEGHVGQVTSLVMGNGMLFSGGQARSVFFLLSSLFFVVVAEAGNRQRGMQNHSTLALTRTHALNIRRIKPFGCGSRP